MKMFSSAFTSSPPHFPDGSGSQSTYIHKTGENHPILALLAPLDGSPGVPGGDRCHPSGGRGGRNLLPTHPTPLVPEIVTAGTNWDAGWQSQQGEKGKQPDTLQLPTKLQGAAAFPRRRENKRLLE